MKRAPYPGYCAAPRKRDLRRELPWRESPLRVSEQRLSTRRNKDALLRMLQIDGLTILHTQAMACGETDGNGIPDVVYAQNSRESAFG